MDSAGSVDVDPVGCKDNSKPTDCFRFFSVFFSPYAFLPMSFTISGMTTTTIAVVASMIVIHFFSVIACSPYAFLPMSFTISGMTTTAIAVAASMILIHFFSLILSSPYMLWVEKRHWNRRRQALIRSSLYFLAGTFFPVFRRFSENTRKKTDGASAPPVFPGDSSLRGFTLPIL